VEEIAQILGADSVGYLDLEYAKRLTGGDGSGFCTACFDGNYPTEIPTESRKNRFEQKISENPKFKKKHN
jgi:amidophosphoribosyltransferase